MNISAATKRKNIAVVGAGPAGLAFATTAAERGHTVTLFDGATAIGGQFNIAKKVPGKEEFNETIRYFDRRLQITGVQTKLGTTVNQQTLNDGDFDEVVLATGIKPRTPPIDGIDHPKVMSYLDVIRDGKAVGKKVAIIGAGGIGFDVAEFLTHNSDSSTNIPTFMREWGVDMSLQARGGIEGITAEPGESPREVYLLQRKVSKVGNDLGKTTGWIHRAGLQKKGVNMVPGCEYIKIDDAGLHIRVGSEERILDVDNVIICAGQESLTELSVGLNAPVHLIGGAHLATELDAKRAIDQGTRLAAAI